MDRAMPDTVTESIANCHCTVKVTDVEKTGESIRRYFVYIISLVSLLIHCMQN